MPDQRRQHLRGLIARGEFFVAPGVYDMISVLISEQLGFPVHYMSGYAVSAAHRGVPDAGIATYSDFVSRVYQMTERATAPLIADADTGFGGLVNVHHTVRGYERAGAAAIQLEDQEMPKKCGHVTGRSVIPVDDMVAKLRVAVDARTDDEMVIIARTDARTTLGLDEALRRAEAYVKAGADVIFVESPESEVELARIGASVGHPVLANMVPGGSRTPVLSAERLRDLGFSFAIYPSLGFMAAAAGIRSAFAHLRQTGSTLELETPLITADEGHRLVGFDAVYALERKFAPVLEAAQ
jgi:2-methylisocitrate lyase-like PEP mutase family enzyme